MIHTLRYCVATALVIGGLGLVPYRADAQRPVALAPNAPKDTPASAASQCQWIAFLAATQPFVDRARATLPAAIERFRSGLPAHQTFFVTTRLTDSLGRHEQVFVAVDSASEGRLLGRIWSRVELVSGYRLYQHYEIELGDVVDWMISNPDGTEEGNEVGKFLDTYTPPTACGQAMHTD